MYKNQINNLIKKILKDLDIKDVPNFNVSYPPNEKMGDYTTNAAMIASKTLKKSPIAIAKEIKSKAEIKKSKIIERIEIVKPGFINFYLKQSVVQDNLKNILKEKDKYGSSNIGNHRVVVIDYSAPNIAKMMHIGHLRSTVIGQAIYNIYNFLGYKVIGDNHIGDWGTHFGKLIYAYKNFCDKEKLKQNFIVEINRIYVDFNARAKEDEKLNDYAREETKKFQDGDKENVKIWKYFVNESIKEFNKIYKILGIKIDHILGESFYQPMLKEVISSALEKKIAIYSQGAVIIPLDKYNLPPFMIKKTDGATLYGTTDLATIKYRIKKWKADKIIYVVANQQAGHFMQLFKASEILGYTEDGMMEHVKFGMILGKDGKKLATREGKVILLDKVIKEAISRAKKIVKEKSPHLTINEKEKIAKVVGIGAIKYNDLSQNRLTDISFDWDKMLDFRGNSAPYLQYTYARIKSILRKSKIKNSFKFNFKMQNDKRELSILRQLVLFDEIVERAGEEMMPNIIADYIYKLANNFNSFYENVQVLTAEKDLCNARLGLILAVSIVIKNGLKLLGVETIEKM